MEASPSAMLKLLLPKTPFIFKTALWHTLSLSPTSSKWDLRTELTIKILRQMLGPTAKPQSITKQQRMTTRDPGIKGKVWVSKVKCPVPEEDDLRQALFKAIAEMRDGGEKDEEIYTEPDAVPLEAEWTGYRTDATDSSPEPAGFSETQKYEALIKETTSKVTLLYFHGGAMYLLDPATYRPITSKLAKATGGRVFSVRYRLAPQNPFPAAILDALTAYLTLLYPPAGAPHEPVPAHEIVFGGDSAGGMLCTSLLQLLLQLHRTNPTPGGLPTVKFHGREVAIPLPAGVALSSPWLDVTRSLPSIEALAHYDYLPPPSETLTIKFPPCAAWPSSPPRADLYCEGAAMVHPLASPLAARDWRGAPPLFFSLGEEMLRDEDAVLAQRVVKQGGTVVWREFEAMPHCFGMMLEYLPAAVTHVEEFAKFCRDVVEKGGEMVSSGEVVLVKGKGRKEVNVGSLIELTDEEVEGLMREGRKSVKGGIEVHTHS
ncbi:acetyl-hydrolase [Melanomma pulvis-pyrius CBS 109.77]|uniref:Acetyl-hydrolase n=1 Tax=Melanomma pulvis-pyrius CBS 109.77 TaxID=1314802 RepID=A0A6A6X5B1_9PLEO|nr:acetyl-hydrolase [Melanomma pulvis-pyrius CBS 109.77]